MDTQHTSKFVHAVESNNKRAIKANAVATLTLEEFEAAYIYFGGKCAYSGQSFTSESQISIEHIIPIMSGGHSMAFNCIPVITKYNSSKSGYHLLDWWRCQTDGMNNTTYNPFRLLKLINYMIKALEGINTQDSVVHILMDNEIDTFLSQNREKLETNFEKGTERQDFKKISQLEVLRKMDMVRIEDLYAIYSELDNITLNPAIFFEEALHELDGKIPDDVLAIVSSKINNLPDIYIDGKKVFKKEMKPEDIKIRKAVLAWAEKEKLENKYGIIGYMDFEVLKLQPDVTEFLESRKKLILGEIGANSRDFNNLINKVPNILTNLGVDNRIKDIAKHFNLSTDKTSSRSSELYRYVVNKPDLLLSGENMEILLRYVEELKVDKRLLKKGVPIPTIIDNIEMAMEIVKRAELNADEKVQRRVLLKLINSTTGSSLRSAYKEFRNRVKERDESLDTNTIKKDASRWIVCISEKYNASEILKEKRINKTKGLYQNMRFNEEGFMIGVNVNAYIVPKIISLANLDISREAEAEIINNVFLINHIKQGHRADLVLKDLASVLKAENKKMSDDELMQEAARWFVFLSESSQVYLGVMFDNNVKGRYIDVTKKYYKKMQFDSNGNFVDFEMEELKDLVIGIDYMKLADSFLKSAGEFYVIKGKYIPKEDIREKLYEKLSKCKNKKSVKATCIRMLRDISKSILEGEEEDLGRD